MYRYGLHHHKSNQITWWTDSLFTVDGTVNLALHLIGGNAQRLLLIITVSSGVKLIKVWDNSDNKD